MKATTSTHYNNSQTLGYFTGSQFGVAIIREELRANESDEMAWYFNDLYKLFLHHYANLGHSTQFSPEEELKMTAMLAELCKVKRMMQQASEIC